MTDRMDNDTHGNLNKEDQIDAEQIHSQGKEKIPKISNSKRRNNETEQSSQNVRFQSTPEDVSTNVLHVFLVIDLKTNISLNKSINSFLPLRFANGS